MGKIYKEGALVLDILLVLKIIHKGVDSILKELIIFQDSRFFVDTTNAWIFKKIENSVKEYHIEAEKLMLQWINPHQQLADTQLGT